MTKEPHYSKTSFFGLSSSKFIYCLLYLPKNDNGLETPSPKNDVCKSWGSLDVVRSGGQTRDQGKSTCSQDNSLSTRYCEKPRNWVQFDASVYLPQDNLADRTITYSVIRP